FAVEVPRSELLRRLSGRRWCPTCQSTYHVDNKPPRADMLCDREGAQLIQREDDKEVAVARRLAEYDERTAPLIDYYRGRSRFFTVNGDRPPDAVFTELKTMVGPEKAASGSASRGPSCRRCIGPAPAWLRRSRRGA